MTDTQAMTIRLPTDLYETLRQTAFERRIAMNALTIDAITEWLQLHGYLQRTDTP